MKKLAIAVAISALVCSGAYAEKPTTYSMVIAGKECKEDVVSQLISCKYKVGESLRFSIDGVGLPDTGITFSKSDIDGDFFATYGIGHGCVVVKSGWEKNGEIRDRLFSGMAFIQPKTGKVYKTFEECAAGK